MLKEALQVGGLYKVPGIAPQNPFSLCTNKANTKPEKTFSEMPKGYPGPKAFGEFSDRL